MFKMRREFAFLKREISQFSNQYVIIKCFINACFSLLIVFQSTGTDILQTAIFAVTLLFLSCDER